MAQRDDPRGAAEVCPARYWWKQSKRQAETGRPKPRGYVACRGALSEAFMDGALATHLPWSGLQAA